MPRLEIDKPLEIKLEVEKDKIERNLGGKGYRKTRRERMNDYKKTRPKIQNDIEK